MPLANVAWFAVFNWANPTVTQLEDQSVTPLFNDHPIELGLYRKRSIPPGDRDRSHYRRPFHAFPGDQGPYTFVHIRKALAAFERTLISGNSPYDHYRYRHEENAISESAKRGEDLFSIRPKLPRCTAGSPSGAKRSTRQPTMRKALNFKTTVSTTLPGNSPSPQTTRPL